MKLGLTYILIMVLSLLNTAQAAMSISGKVVSAKTSEPIENTLVYVNGTDIGCFTDANGNFELDNISLPCVLILSRVGFELKQINLTSYHPQSLSIMLDEKNTSLKDVNVSGVSRREENLNKFRKWFLGDDKWGKSAKIDGDKALLFWHQTDTIFRQPDKEDSILLQYKKSLGKGYGWTEDNKQIRQVVEKFCARSTASFSVDLPLLGYRMDLDLENFCLSSTNDKKTRQYVLYSHFTELPTNSEKQQNKINENRSRLYWNSSRHFFKSVVSNTLESNGYLLCFDYPVNRFALPKNRKYIDINKYITRDNEKTIVTGLKGKTIVITYFCRGGNQPVDIAAYKIAPWEFIDRKGMSSITFLSDTCLILNNGSNPDMTLSFEGAMALRGAGTMLPTNYVPLLTQEASPETVASVNNIQIHSDESNMPDIGVSNNFTPKSMDLNRTAFQNATSISKQYPQEKAYLHFDNTAYFLGETIWFKAYMVTAERNALSQLSKTLYAELITPEGKVLSSKKLKIEDGQCHGEFLLQDSLRSGFYEVRAYTRYMLNQGEEGIFSRTFPVYLKPKKQGDYDVRKMRERSHSQRIPTIRKEYGQKGSLALAFYPEGGNLVVGLQSRVAFKATGSEGENAVVMGEIEDAVGNKVADIETSYLGMGVFSFTPDGGKYTAKVRCNDKDYSFELPQALPAGYALAVDNSRGEKIGIQIRKSPQIPSDTLGLTISCRGKPYASDQIPMDGGNLSSLSLSDKLLPSGVSQITLFNKSGQVLCERLVFVNHNSQMKISAAQNKPSYQPFEKVKMDFQLNDMKGNPVESTFSLSVRDAGSSSFNPYADNILTNLLLSSELKGYIENPGYYFESDAPARKAALDLLMLTQGWSRYHWTEMAGITKPEVKHPVEKSLVIEGRVLSLAKKKPKANVEVLMFIIRPDSTSQRGTCTTDEEGKFNFALEDFRGRAKLSLQTKENGKKKENNIILYRMFSPEVKEYAFQEKQNPENFVFRIDSVSSEELSIQIDSLKNEVVAQQTEAKIPMDKKNHLLKEVEVKGRKQFRREGEGLRNASIVYDMEKETDEIIDKGEDEPASILDFLMKQNPYFSYQLDKVIPLSEGINTGNYSQPAIHARYKGKDVIFCLNNKPLVGFDTFQKVFNIQEADNDLSGIYSTEVESVMVVETSGASLVYSPKLSGEEAVIFIYTYQDFHSRNSLLGIRQTKFDGYTYTKEFYNPNYEYAPLPNEKDYRRTLYWNPDVKTDASGKATVSFYNNATSKLMNVSAETVTANGVMGALCK